MLRVNVAERLSRWWMASILISVVLALGLGGLATYLGVESTKPVGEGELLAADAQSAAAAVERGNNDATDVDETLGHLRNRLEIEAVGLVDATGAVVASTSPSMIGPPALDPFLIYALSEGVFAAVAKPSPWAVNVASMQEWRIGDTLYFALQPIEGGGGVVMVYDVSELLERRARATALAPAVIPLGIAGAALLLIAGVVAAARSRAVHARRRMAFEANLMRIRSAELEHHNVELTEARAETERALALAEEKNRIRAEFVLMINHELRTPLTGVVTGARLLEASPSLAGDDRDLLADIITDGERLESMIGQMLAVARVENRGLFVNSMSERVSQLIPRLKLAHRRAAVSVRPGFDVERTSVVTDVTTLCQLVATLVDNSYTHGATRAQVLLANDLPVDPDLEVGERPTDPIFVMVVDNGPGIDAAFLPRAFEKFEKSGMNPGTGLGLHMAKMMADAIGASISVVTSKSGTAMAIGLPQVAVREVAV